MSKATKYADMTEDLYLKLSSGDWESVKVLPSGDLRIFANTEMVSVSKTNVIQLAKWILEVYGDE